MCALLAVDMAIVVGILHFLRQEICKFDELADQLPLTLVDLLLLVLYDDRLLLLVLVYTV